MVAAEDTRAGHFRVCQEFPQFTNKALGCERCKGAPLHILVQGHCRRNNKGQGTEHGRVDGRYDVCCMQGVFVGPFLAAQAEENHGG